MSWSRSVFSSMVSEISYDTDSKEMVVTWSRGKRSIYSGVPEELADRISKAPSVGQAINTEIKGAFSHRYG